jgi:uncharacterized short protein YbdD (DUF466 family)
LSCLEIRIFRGTYKKLIFILLAGINQYSKYILHLEFHIP